MKKSLLLLAASFAFLSSFAQNDCATAVALTTSGTITAAAPAGTVETLCFTQTAADASQTTSPLAARWYKFIPTTNGIVNINSNLTTNVAPNSVDTRVSIFTGTCSALTCLDANDDVSSTAYLSNITFTAVVGTTYYIYWDNYWDAGGFNFDFTFTPVSCLPVAGINNPTLVTSTSATLNWAVSPSVPANGYEVEYGAVGFVQGTGTIVATATNSLALSSLIAGNNYDYYVRAKCSSTDNSAWTSVSTLSLNKTLPYASGLDTANTLAGWTIFGGSNQGLGNSATAAQSPSGYWIFNTAAAPGPNNNWLFTPKFNILAGEQVTISFYHRATTTARTLRVTAGLSNSVAAQTIELLNATIAAGTTWTQVTVPAYTFATAGTYVFAFHDNSTATPATASSMRIDTINITSVLSTDTFTLRGVSMYPNPATDILNIQSETEELTKVSITDLNGRIVKEVTNNLSQISLENLAKGIYMVTIESATAKKVEKLIVE
jgi:hypothetical protein